MIFEHKPINRHFNVSYINQNRYQYIFLFWVTADGIQDLPWITLVIQRGPYGTVVLNLGYVQGKHSA